MHQLLTINLRRAIIFHNRLISMVSRASANDTFGSLFRWKDKADEILGKTLKKKTSNKLTCKASLPSLNTALTAAVETTKSTRSLTSLSESKPCFAPPTERDYLMSISENGTYCMFDEKFTNYLFSHRNDNKQGFGYKCKVKLDKDGYPTPDVYSANCSKRSKKISRKTSYYCTKQINRSNSSCSSLKIIRRPKPLKVGLKLTSKRGATDIGELEFTDSADNFDISEEPVPNSTFIQLNEDEDWRRTKITSSNL